MRAYGTANTNDFAALLSEKLGTTVINQKIYDMSFRILNGKRVRVLGQRIGGRLMFSMSESGVNQPDLRNARVLASHPGMSITTPRSLFNEGKLTKHEYTKLNLALYDAKLAKKFRHMYIQLTGGKGGYTRYVFDSEADINKFKEILKGISLDPKTNTVHTRIIAQPKHMTVIHKRQAK